MYYQYLSIQRDESTLSTVVGIGLSDWLVGFGRRTHRRREKMALPLRDGDD
jgi:hypothetical protein